MARSKDGGFRLARVNLRIAGQIWVGRIHRQQRSVLRTLSREFRISVAAGDVQLLDGQLYVTHTGLLGIARRKRCHGIRCSLVKSVSAPSANRWVFKAVVLTSKISPGFVGYGDADPSNVSPLVHGAEMRVAETRAVNRALRKAYGIGTCSVEELGWTPRPSESAQSGASTSPADGNGAHPRPRLRDRLCLLIRHHRLDPTLVKSYAADYCGTSSLRDASRERLEAFVTELADRATKDRDALVCHLNSYSEPKEVHA